MPILRFSRERRPRSTPIFIRAPTPSLSIVWNGSLAMLWCSWEERVYAQEWSRLTPRRHPAAAPLFVDRLGRVAGDDVGPRGVADECAVVVAAHAKRRLRRIHRLLP